MKKLMLLTALLLSQASYAQEGLPKIQLRLHVDEITNQERFVMNLTYEDEVVEIPGIYRQFCAGDFLVPDFNSITSKPIRLTYYEVDKVTMYADLVSALPGNERYELVCENAEAGGVECRN